MFATRNSIISHLCWSTKTITTTTLSPLLRSAALLSHHRQFSTAPERRLVRDTAYPFPLYYHLLPPTSTPSSTTISKASYALSFLPTFPHHTHQVVGYISHNNDSEDLQVKPNKFTENDAFNNVLHMVIQQNLADDPMVESVLQQQLEGWTHIADYRNPAPYGRIPLPEDIFGSVQIVDGVIQPESYQRMPTHRIVSSLGLFQLSDHLHERLVHHLKNL
ncbi:hypothetical protein BG015_000446 [Linnemannia schmuckeri]|uniref:Uncharacterized protein n=1 Tax=Linnemannia schmuckeri TaxID=64567 RepID=A0A9P5S4F5_9FUNG|nr:hypothetical protein BG015_000446 [Linnemannia schmuckeri]